MKKYAGRRYSILNMSVIPKLIKLIIIFNLVPIKIPGFINIDKLILKFINSKRSRIVKQIFKRIKLEKSHKRQWYWWSDKNRPMGQKESPDTDPHKWRKVIFGMGAKSM